MTRITTSNGGWTWPKQPLLRISLGYQQMRQGDLAKAIETLEAVTSPSVAKHAAFSSFSVCIQPLLFERIEPYAKDAACPSQTRKAKVGLS